MEKKKLAVIFPGVGYNKYKPLLYYSGKMAMLAGYEVLRIEYRDLPMNINGDKNKMLEAGKLAYVQACEQLKDVDFSAYEDVLFIGKSIGTAVCAMYADEFGVNARQIWYTPVEFTFTVKTSDAVSFIGAEDPLSDIPALSKRAEELGIPFHIYEGCNHSLECADVNRCIEVIGEVMKLTEEYIKRR